MAIETEKKYRLDKRRLVELTAKLSDIGATFAGETFEENYLHRGGRLEERDAFLRLRKTGEISILTYKEKIRGETGYKHQIEHETNVSDVDEMEHIIERLGYRLSIVYEKHRKTWHFGSVEVVLDELPFGYYMEIEGAIEDIEAAEKTLRVDDLEIEQRGYPRLTQKYGTELGEVTEARFSKRPER